MSASSNGHWTVEVVLDDSGATIRSLSREQARDLLDAGRALLATEDLALVAYVAARPDLEVVALPWDRTYVYVSPTGGGSLGTESFADAVRIDARPADRALCDTIFTNHGPTPHVSSRVVYDAGDRSARDLAERIVALTSRSRAAAVGLAEFEVALRSGSDLAYIVSVPRSSGHACEVQAALRARAEWISTGSFVPLIDTRAYAIIPRDSSP